MAHFVLVHGAWHGGWCWRDVADLVRNAGHDVHALTLTGLGERAGLLTQEVGLHRHIDDVVELIDSLGLEGVILVGHSYGGMVVSGAADRLASRLAHVVYLDAVVPLDGEAVLRTDVSRPDVEFLESLRTRADEHGDGWRVPPPVPAADGSLFGVTDLETVRWMGDNLTPHPLAAWTDQVSLTSPEADRIPRTYVECVRPPGQAKPYLLDQARARQAGWDYVRVRTGHDVMLTEPRFVAGLMARIAASR